MKQLIKSQLRSLLRFVPSYRRWLINYLMSEKLSDTLKELQSKGLNLRVVYDIGARHGDWTKQIRQTLTDSEFILFDANERCSSYLARSGFKFFIGVLSSEVKIVDFYDNDSTGDSYYKENTVFYDSVKSVKRTTTTLDLLVSQNDVPLPDFIKLDTQGSELDILYGALAVLRHASLAYLECPVLNYNDGAPVFQNYIDFLNTHGFVPYEICELHHAHGVLVQMDVLFICKAKLLELYPLSAKILHCI